MSIWAVPAGVNIAVSHVNEGNLAEALEILDHIIATTKGTHISGAHVTRGTARAMLRDLQGATPEDSSPCLLLSHSCARVWDHARRKGLAMLSLSMCR